MFAAYGIDVHRPISNRRLHVLLERLPSHTRRSSDEREEWSTEAHLLANVFDAVQVLSYINVRVANPKAHPPRPRPLPRPGQRSGRSAASQARSPRPPAVRGSDSPTGPRASGFADLLRALRGTDGVISNG